MLFKDKIFSLLGPNEKRTDSNKNSSGKGTLERYMSAFGDDIDTNIVPLIENLVQNTTDIELMFTRFLDVQEETRGVLPLSFSRGSSDEEERIKDEWMRRRLLLHIEKILAVRGTKKGFQLLFRLIDSTITVITINEAFSENFYDESEFDDGLKFDVSICSECPVYSIVIVSDGTTEPTDYIIKCAKSIIAFNQPIDVKLGTITYNGFAISL